MTSSTNKCLLLFLVITCQQLCASFIVHKESKAEELYKQLMDTDENTVLSAASQQQARQGSVEKKQCYPLSIPICRRLGYNATSSRRDIYGDKDKDADIAKYLEFFENEICFEDLIFFVCTLFNPICFKNQQRDILPCRSECRNVKKQCKGTIDKFRLRWPSQLKCNNLPDYQTDVCLTRKSIVTPKQLARQNEADLLKLKSRKKCPVCAKHEVPPQHYKQFKKADYALEGQYLSKTKTSDSGFKLSFLVKKVFKHGTVHLVKYGIAHIWTQGSCLCPNLSYDKKYVILGSENEATHRLMFDENTLVVQKTRFWKRLLLQWKRKYRSQRIHHHRRQNIKLRVPQ